MFDSTSVLAAVNRVVGDAPRPVALHEPTFQANEWRYLKECLDSGWVSSGGDYVDRFERELGDHVGGFAVAVVNGTAALHACLLLAGVEANDEVLVPALTFIATANAVSYCGAVPHFVDSTESTLGMDPDRLAAYLGDVASITADACWNRRTGRRIRAMVPMHTFGHPVDLDPLLDIADRFRLVVVEDAAESLGSYYKGKHTGTIGSMGAISFNGNKVITTGGGGAVVTRDQARASAARHLTTTARIKHRWSFMHDQVGYNYRMPNINAALGCAQLGELPALLGRKRELAQRYVAEFANIKGARIFSEPAFASSNYWLNVLVLDESQSGSRDEILELTNASGIHTRPAWTPISSQSMYAKSPQMELQAMASLERRIICLPSSPRLAN